MKQPKFVIIAVIAILSIIWTSCEKDETKPTNTNNSSATVSGTFTVNGVAQTPTFATRKVTTDNTTQKTFTQTLVKNDNYSLMIDFTNATMASGEYTITQEFETGNRNANITFKDEKAGKATLVVDLSKKVTVSGDRITFPTVNFNLDGKNFSLAGDYTVKAN